MTLEKVLATIEQEQNKYALQALLCPGDKTEFEYGERCGIVRGYAAAIAHLKNAQRAEEVKNGDL